MNYLQMTLIAGLVLIAVFAVWVQYKKTSMNDVSTKIELQEGEALAYFAGGCFWCVESDLEKLPEIRDAISGYMGGTVENPDYYAVAGGKTDHRESVAVIYSPEKTNYRDLVLQFMKTHDPTDPGGSFYDRGFQYTSAIYYQNDEEKQIAESVIVEIADKYPKPIVTSLEPAGTFWSAEDYHQDFKDNNPVRYKAYRFGSGRDAYIDSIWEKEQSTVQSETQELIKKETMDEQDMIENNWENFEKPSDAELQEILTPLQYKVTQKEGTEPPRTEGNYDDNKLAGIYVDIISGEPLYSSTDKFDSGTGWPSFTKEIDSQFITTTTDRKLFFPRTEVRSKFADSHLGHVFRDGPTELNGKESTGLRHCINGAALRFVAKEDMEKEGYGDYLYLFD